VNQFKYLGATITNINSTDEENKSRSVLGNTCCDSVQNLLSSSLLSENITIKIPRTLALRRKREQGIREDYITKSFVLCTSHQIKFGCSNQEGLNGQGMWHIGETGFWWEGDHLEDLGMGGRIILKWFFKQSDGGHGLE
jgi:hypothetical protein